MYFKTSIDFDTFNLLLKVYFKASIDFDTLNLIRHSSQIIKSELEYVCIKTHHGNCFKMNFNAVISAFKFFRIGVVIGEMIFLLVLVKNVEVDQMFL